MGPRSEQTSWAGARGSADLGALGSRVIGARLVEVAETAAALHWLLSDTDNTVALPGRVGGRGPVRRWWRRALASAWRGASGRGAWR